jgi:hypothetical protein
MAFPVFLLCAPLRALASFAVKTWTPLKTPSFERLPLIQFGDQDLGDAYEIAGIF